MNESDRLRLVVHKRPFKLSIDRDTIISQIVLSGSLSGSLRYLCHLFFNSAAYGTYIFLLIVLFQLLLYVLIQKGRVAYRITFVLLAYIGFMSIIYLLFPNNRIYYKEYFNDLITICLIGIPGAVLISDIDDIDHLLLKMRPFLRISAIVFPLMYILGAYNYFGYMMWGSRMLPIPLLYGIYLNRFKSRFDSVLFYVSIVFTLFGGRQSFVILISGIIIIHLFDNNKKRKTIFILAMSMLLLILFIYYEPLLNLLSNFLNIFHIRSRSLMQLSNQSLFDSSNRINIYQNCIYIIRKNGIKVSGLFADRYYLRQYRSNIAYAHNIILEVLIDFGLIIGGILIVWYIVKTIKLYVQTNIRDRMFVLLFFLICVARLFVSSSLFISSTFPLFFGLLINRKIRQE